MKFVTTPGCFPKENPCGKYSILNGIVSLNGSYKGLRQGWMDELGHSRKSLVPIIISQPSVKPTTRISKKNSNNEDLKTHKL
jgi:hypothetical protein